MPKQILPTEIDLVGLRELFHAIYLSSGCRNSKPQPEFLWKSSKNTSWTPEKTVMVGMTLRQMSLLQSIGWRVSWSMPHTWMNCARSIKQVCVIRDIQELQERLWRNIIHGRRPAASFFSETPTKSNRICQIFKPLVYYEKVNLNKEIKWITYQTVQNVTPNTLMKMERSWCAQSAWMETQLRSKKKRVLQRLMPTETIIDGDTDFDQRFESEGCTGKDLKQGNAREKYPYRGRRPQISIVRLMV